MTDRTENDAAADLAMRSVEPQPVDPGNLYSLALPEGGEHVVLDTEPWLPAPRRKHGTVRLTEGASLATYVNAHQGDGTALYADVEQHTVVGVLNDHGEGGAGWGDHRAVLRLKLSREWQRWANLDGRLLTQTEFAEHIEASLPDVHEPPAAELLELAQTFHANTAVEFKSSSLLASGQRQFHYVETTTAKAGLHGDLTVPTQFGLGLRPFDGTDAYKLTARLRFRLGGGDLRIGYVLDRPEDVIEAAFADVLADIETSTGLVAYRGVPPSDGPQAFLCR